jgi:curli biogenesis system outer membrane secretion channel CsgG
MKSFNKGIVIGLFAAMLCICRPAVAQTSLEDTVRSLAQGLAQDVAAGYKSASSDAAAVLDFKVTNPKGLRNIGTLASDEIELALSDAGTFQLADRGQISAVLKEQKLAMSGITRAEDAEKVGRLAGVNRLLFGHILVGENSVSAQLRLVDIESGRILWLGTRSGNFSDDLGYLDEEIDQLQWIEAAADAAHDAAVDLLSKKPSAEVSNIGVGRLRNTSGYGFYGFEEIATDSVVERLWSAKRFQLIERQYLDGIFKEAKFAQSGMVDMDQVAELGNIIGADAVVAGDVKIRQTGERADALGKRNAVTVEAAVTLKLLSVETGMVLATGRAQKTLKR